MDRKAFLMALQKAGAPDEKDFEDYLKGKKELPKENPPPENAKDDPSPRGRDFVNGLIGAGQGASFDFGDEIYGLGGGLESAMYGADPIDGYTSARDEARRRIHQAEAESPKSFMAGNLVGGLAVPIPGFGAAKVAKGAMPLGRIIAEATVKDFVKDTGRRIATSAGMGALKRAGQSEADNLKDFASDVAEGAVESADTLPVSINPTMDQIMRRIGDVIDFKKMKDKKSSDSGGHPKGGKDGWFSDRVESLLEREKKKGVTGNLGKLTPEMMAENNKRAMKESGLDRGKSFDDFSDPRKIRDLEKVDGDLNVARNKVEREYEKILEKPDYGENSYLRPRGEFRSVPPKDDMSFTEFAKALERGEKYHPEDAMKDPFERDRWDIFRAQANMADKSEAADKLEALAGKYLPDKQIFDQVDDLKGKANHWKNRSEEWSDDLSALQKRVDSGEKIPGINRPELSFEERADDFARSAMRDESGFRSEKEAKDWYMKQYDPKAQEKRQLAREKKYRNDNLEGDFRRELSDQSAHKIQYGDDDVTWPKRDLDELSGPVKFTKGSNNQLGIARKTFDDFEDYAMALERGDKVPSPIEALRDPRELEKFQLFAKQAKGLDQEQLTSIIQDLMKGKYKDIKSRRAVKDILASMKKSSSENLRSDDSRWPYARRDLKWNPSDSE